MIYIKLENPLFYDDAVVLVRSFYPRMEVAPYRGEQLAKEDILIEPYEPETEGRTKREFHDDFKEKLYNKLKEKTNTTLPWGYMTGVRPSKMVYIDLEEGRAEQDIIQEFREKYQTSPEKAELAMNVAKKEKSLLDKIDYKNGYSLYIGIPFCPTICLYCSFSSYSLKAYESYVNDYLDALIKEMTYVSEAMKGKRLDTIYFGGGTPTTLSASQLDRLLTALWQLFDVENALELTVEAGRPDSITLEKLQVLKKHKVDRISINPQTMNQETLDLIGRRHSVEQIIDAFHLAREAGFDNINMDIILGLPGEDMDMVRHTLEEIKKLSPESLTVHSLAIKRAAGLNIWREKYNNLQIENSAKIVSMAADYAKTLGHEPYYMYRQKNMAGNFENVGYAAAGKECIYNILIMEEKQTIIACGAGASSKMVFQPGDDPQDTGRIERIENVKDVKSYIERTDEMIDRKKTFFLENPELFHTDENRKLYNTITNDFKSGISHGILVANLTYALAKRLGVTEEEAYEMKLAAILHDIGKLKLSQYLYGRNQNGLSIEEMKYMRMHSKISYELLKKYDYSDNIMEIVLRHHECFDGSGYPDNIQGEAIPLGARILRVTDEFAALISDRPYRKAFDYDTAVEVMIEEVKNMDMKIFIEFQRMIHEESTYALIENSKINLDELDIRAILDI